MEFGSTDGWLGFVIAQVNKIIWSRLFRLGCVTSALWVVVTRPCGWCGCVTLCCSSSILLVVWESSSSARRRQLRAAEVNRRRLSKYYPFLWKIITPLIYEPARCSLKTQFQMVKQLRLCVEAQTVALGHRGGGGGGDGSVVYEAYCWKMDSSVTGCV